MSKLHILHGLPGTGKSTFAQKLRDRGRTIVLNNDEWMIQLFGTNPPINDFPGNREKIERIQWEMAVSLIKEGMDVVWDYGVWTKAERAELISRAIKGGIDFLFYRMVCPWELALKRVLDRTQDSEGKCLVINKAAMEYFLTIFEPVEETEGFNVIDVDDIQ